MPAHVAAAFRGYHGGLLLSEENSVLSTSKRMSPYESVYAIVRRIPRGKVLTYGVISNLLSGRLSAQGVGWAMRALESVTNARGSGLRVSKQAGRLRSQDTLIVSNAEGMSAHRGSFSTLPGGQIPWHRVINSQGALSTHKNPNIPPGLQRALLETEGVKFDRDEKIDLDKHLYKRALRSKS